MVGILQMLPYLGATTRSFDTSITAQLLTNGSDVYKFLEVLQKMLSMIIKCQVVTSPHLLIQHTIQQIWKSNTHQDNIHDILIDFNKHIRMFTMSTPFVKHNTMTITNKLCDLKAPSNTTITDKVITVSRSSKLVVNDVMDHNTAQNDLSSDTAIFRQTSDSTMQFTC